jgi:hypothetical protein
MTGHECANNERNDRRDYYFQAFASEVVARRVECALTMGSKIFNQQMFTERI